MNIKKFFMHLCFLVLFGCSGKQLIAHSFPISNIQQGVAQAAQEQKLLIAHFMADWCMPSHWMEKNIFSQEEITYFLNANYVGIKVDVDANEGFLDQQKYEVHTLPTILIFSASGQLLTRIEGITDEQSLFHQLKQFNTSNHKKGLNKIPPPPSVESMLAGVDMSHLSKPALIPTKSKHVAERRTYPTTKPSMSSTPSSPNTEPDQKIVYGIEVAILNQYAQVIKYVRDLEGKLNERVYIHFDKVEGQKRYHIIVGRYPQRRAAFQALEKLRNLQLKGVLKSY